MASTPPTDPNLVRIKKPGLIRVKSSNETWVTIASEDDCILFCFVVKCQEFYTPLHAFTFYLGKAANKKTVTIVLSNSITFSKLTGHGLPFIYVF